MPSTLANLVLPLIRTRADLHRYSDANRHGGQMHEAVDILEEALPFEDPVVAHDVTQKAVASAMKIIARADDSSGIIGGAIERLLQLHPATALIAEVPARRLVDWMMKFQFGDGIDCFNIDPVDYAPALGDRGMAAYRAALAAVREEVGPTPADWFASQHRRAHTVLDWNDRRLAVYDGDVDAIIRTHTRGMKKSAWDLDAAKALNEIGATEEAIGWARRASQADPWHQAVRAADFWCELLAEHRPGEVVDARVSVLRQWPSSSTAAKLYDAAHERWPEYRDEVIATLSEQPIEAVNFALNSLKDPTLAWYLAHSLDLDSPTTWVAVIDAYETIDPAATLPLQEEMVRGILVDADARSYRKAARRLAGMRKLAAGTDASAHVEQLVAELRETYQRRPRLQEEFDRFGLP